MLKLNGVEETMLIPLAIKANETQRKNARIKDKKAVEIINKLNIDTAKYDKFMSHEGVVARTILFDKEIKEFINKYPDAVCISIGCGFDNRFERVDNGKIKWYNLDFPDVINARKNFFNENSRVSCIAGSALDEKWTNEIEKDKTAIILIEGVLMYFSKEEVINLFNIIKTSFKHSIILAEIMPSVLIGFDKHHDTVKATKAKFKWGLKTCADAEKLCDRLNFVRAKSFNVEMKKYSLRGKIFSVLPIIKNFNNSLAVYELNKQ